MNDTLETEEVHARNLVAGDRILLFGTEIEVEDVGYEGDTTELTLRQADQPDAESRIIWVLPVFSYARIVQPTPPRVFKPGTVVRGEYTGTLYFRTHTKDRWVHEAGRLSIDTDEVIEREIASGNYRLVSEPAE